MDYIIREDDATDIDMHGNSNKIAPNINDELTDSDKYKKFNRYNYLLDWDKWTDKEKDSIFFPLVIFVKGYVVGENNNSIGMGKKITDTIIEYGTKYCRDFDKIVPNMHDDMTVKGDALIFNPVDINKIPVGLPYNEIREKILSWGKFRGFLSI